MGWVLGDWYGCYWIGDLWGSKGVAGRDGVVHGVRGGLGWGMCVIGVLEIRTMVVWYDGAVDDFRFLV